MTLYQEHGTKVKAIFLMFDSVVNKASCVSMRPTIGQRGRRWLVNVFSFINQCVQGEPWPMGIIIDFGKHDHRPTHCSRGLEYYKSV